MINTNDKHREERKLISRHSLGNGKSEGGWLTYHFDRFKFRIRTKNGFSYNMRNRIGTLNEQINYWKGQKVYLDEVVQCVT